LFRCGTIETNIAEVRVAAECCTEVDVCQSVGNIGPNFRFDLRVEKAVPVEVRLQVVLRFLNIESGVGFLSGIIRSLDESWVRQSVCAGKMVHAEVQRRLQDEHYANTVLLGPDVKLNALKQAAALQRGNCVVDLGNGKRVAGFQTDPRHELLDVQVWTA